MSPTAQTGFCPPPLPRQPDAAALLLLNPERRLEFTGPFTHRTHTCLTLSNGSITDRVAYKIKSTATKGCLAVKPARGVVEPNQTIKVEFTMMSVARNPSLCPPTHRILIKSVVIDKRSLDLDAIWQVTMWKRLMVNKLECVYSMPLPGFQLQDGGGAEAASWGQRQQSVTVWNRNQQSQQPVVWNGNQQHKAADWSDEAGQAATSNEVAISAVANDAWNQRADPWAGNDGWGLAQAPGATASDGWELAQAPGATANDGWGLAQAPGATANDGWEQAQGNEAWGEQEAGQPLGTQDQGGWDANNNYDPWLPQQDQGWENAVEHAQPQAQNAYLPMIAGDQAKIVSFDAFRDVVFSCHVFSLLLCIGIIIGKCWL